MPVVSGGIAIIGAATLLMCFASLTLLSCVLKASDEHYAEVRLLKAELLLKDVVSLETTRAVASTADVAPPKGQFIRFDLPTLPPMAFTQFCLKYVDECKPKQLLFRGGRMKVTNQRWAELERINRSVNSSILPEPNRAGLAGEKWLLDPAAGDCNDYAVTKRHLLTAAGWPARDVLLSEVVTVSGEHHVVLVVRTSDDDLVLDNLTDRIMPWFQKQYQWVRIQKPTNPNYWMSVSEQSA
ncbi:transglutaminase-like cysteine peptidase [Bradyrhizobium sp.]|uniref:transglutaminase-like cysteine peptidase n=1 Tax=Bradyrhizobium sp. TaxID=376 RepID=UPI00261538EA|nr:transglutaminase-like cysteine peptidase [Bradyrhizobium sp.]